MTFKSFSTLLPPYATATKMLELIEKAMKIAHAPMRLSLINSRLQNEKSARDVENALDFHSPECNCRNCKGTKAHSRESYDL